LTFPYPRFALAWSAILISVWATSALAQDAPSGLSSHNRRVSASASGPYYVYDEAWQLYEFQRCEVTTDRDVTGQSSETRVTLHEGSSWSGGYADRTLVCPVSLAALRVHPNNATVEVTFDAEAADCSSTGLIHTDDPESDTEWVFTGVQTLQADLLSPSCTERAVTSSTKPVV
jgi:hypothetical protein